MMVERSILITGCSSGIGYVAATALHARGYRVFATARKPDDVQRLTEQGLTALTLDLADSESISVVVEDVLKQTGGTLYALFNNGAYGQPGAVEDLSRAVLRQQFETNLFGWHELTCRIIPVMRAQGYGRIVQNSSVLGLVAMRWRGAYNASKFAIEGLTDTLRLELTDSNIHVSLIEPGPIASRFRANALAQFQAHVDVQNSIHRESYQKQIERLQSEDVVSRFTLQPEAVVKKLIHALESQRPKVRYHVTFPTHLFAGLRRILPTRWLDRLLVKG